MERVGKLAKVRHFAHFSEQKHYICKEKQPFNRLTQSRHGMDKLTPQQRHKCMASIHSKNTKPELIVRKYLWRQGFRYRLNNPRLPGHPDLVLRKYRTCVFVHGCFWHGHADCRHYKLPQTHTDFWANKIKRNQERDIREQRRLADMGWHVIIVWECELKPQKQEATLASLAFTLNRIFLQDHSIRYPTITPETCIAAEPDPR